MGNAISVDCSTIGKFEGWASIVSGEKITNTYMPAGGMNSRSTITNRAAVDKDRSTRAGGIDGRWPSGLAGHQTLRCIRKAI